MTFSLMKDRVLKRWGPRQEVQLESQSLLNDWEDVSELDRMLYRGKEIGVTGLEIKRQDDGTFEVNHGLELRLRIMMVQQKISWRSRIFLDENFVLDRFRMKINAGLLAEWDVDGFVTEKRIYYCIHQGGNDTYGSLEIEQPPSLMSSVSPTLFRSERIRVGDVYHIPVFDPLWNSNQGELTLHVMNEETLTFGQLNVQAYRIDSSFKTNLGGVESEIQSKFWVNDEGKVVRKEIIPDLVAERIVRSPVDPAATDQIMQRLLKPMPMPEMEARQYIEGARRDSVEQTPGIADLIKGFYNNDRN